MLYKFHHSDRFFIWKCNSDRIAFTWKIVLDFNVFKIQSLHFVLMFCFHLEGKKNRNYMVLVAWKKHLKIWVGLISKLEEKTWVGMISKIDLRCINKHHSLTWLTKNYVLDVSMLWTMYWTPLLISFENFTTSIQTQSMLSCQFLDFPNQF